MGGITGINIALATTLVLGGLAMALLSRRRSGQLTEPARLAAEQERTEGRWRFFTENAADAFWVIDLASSRLVEVSPAIHRLCGYTADEVLADSSRALLTPGAVAPVRQALAELLAGWHAGERESTRRFTLTLKHRNGHVVTVEVLTQLQGHAHAPISALNIGRLLAEQAAGGVTSSWPESSFGDESPLLRFHWRKAYESGLPALDREHRELFDDANTLVRTILEHGTDRSRFMLSVDQLLSHVQQHFADEETLLQQMGYPDLVAHAKRHRELVLQATHLREEALAGRISTGDWIDFIANDVVVGHIIREDRKFFPLLALAARNENAAAP